MGLCFFSCGGKKASKYINKAKPFESVKDWPYIAPELRDGAVSPSTASCVFFGVSFTVSLPWPERFPH